MKPIIALFMVATIVALSVTVLVTKNNGVSHQETQVLHEKKVNQAQIPSKKESRFLAEYKNPRASDHCKKDNEICYLQGGSATSVYNYNHNSTCCNNKCVDLTTDNHNCGACKNKCEYTESCCRGKCVYLAYDKRHCGSCNNRCDKGLFCIYGMCDYP